MALSFPGVIWLDLVYNRVGEQATIVREFLSIHVSLQIPVNSISPH